MSRETDMPRHPQRNTVPAWAAPGAGTALTTDPADEPGVVLITGLLCMGGGFLLLRHREDVGGATNYSIRGMPVTTRTPGCIVGLAGVVLILLGAFFVIGATWRLLTG
jgi:hypothetical protein